MHWSLKLRILPPPASWCSTIRLFSNLDLLKEKLTENVKHQIENKYKSIVSSVGGTLEGKRREDNFYVLSMFPYPSGSLHMGHVRVYTISDTLARYYAMNGKNMFQPMGWDAFGLPAENAAHQHGIDPREWTVGNIATMKSQLQGFGCKFNWESELATCDPKYYKWTQALFLDLYHAGLVYRKEATVNWDPIDNTVLADEQVDEQGMSWRSGARVEKRRLSQWFIRTTRLAKDLYEGLSDPVLQDWKDIVNLQKHWIGEPNGVGFEFQILPQPEGEPNGVSFEFQILPQPEATSNSAPTTNTLSIWLPEDRIEDVAKSQGQYITVKSSHILASKTKSSGVVGYARNPFTRSPVPILVNDEFIYEPGQDVKLCSVYTGPEEQAFASSQGLSLVSEVDPKSWTRDEICRFALENQLGGYPVSSKLRDWLISRQRYWGTPIPMVHCPSCGPVPVPYEALPITLPPSPPLPLASNAEWQHCSCPKCGHGGARRETDTMDTFVDSAWYYVRYLDINAEVSFNTDKAQDWLPVDIYIGGKEHAVLHLYYARFIAHFLHAQGKTPAREPFKRLLVQGMIMGQTYREKTSGKYLKPDEVFTKGDGKKGTVYSALTQEPVTVSWEKMSKSKFNGVNPASLISQYGIDSTRLFVLSDVAPTSEKNWSDAAFPGILNWQIKLWILVKDYLKFSRDPSLVKNPLSREQLTVAESKLAEARNKTVKAVSYSYARNQQLNAAICRLQSYTATLRNCPLSLPASSDLYRRYLQELLIMLAPMTPHMASFLWDCCEFDHSAGLWDSGWPQVDHSWPLAFRCMIHKKLILDLQVVKSDLIKLDKTAALSLLVEKIRTNSKMKSFQYLLEDSGLNASNQQIQFSLDPNHDATLVLPFSMKYVDPNKTHDDTSGDGEETNTDDSTEVDEEKTGKKRAKQKSKSREGDETEKKTKKKSKASQT
ncbi:hypothetical protein M8J76_008127 [Diaphorina citri]|nr:hypothetical protein M8J76_008127 [Diaphorina citri]